MDSKERNFLRLIMFLVDICTNVAQKYLSTIILCGEPFQSYLDKQKHILFHLYIYSSFACCQCTSSAKQHKQLSKEQFESLFVFTRGNHFHKGKNVKCICYLNAKENISVKILDMSLAYCILKHCGNLNQSADHWLTTIKTIRNEIVHSRDTKCVEDLEFEDFWNKLEGAVLGLALLIDEKYKNSILAEVNYLKNRQLLSEDVVKELSVWQQWCREKCNDAEQVGLALQNQVSSLTQLCNYVDENVTKHHTNVIRKIDLVGDKVDYLVVEWNDKLGSKISNTSGNELEKNNIVTTKTTPERKIVPLTMEIETPYDWGHAKVNKAVSSIKSMLDCTGSEMRIQTYSIVDTSTNESVKTSLNISLETKSGTATALAIDKKSQRKNVFVSNETTQTVVMLTYMPQDTVRELKRMIQLEEKIHPDLQCLFFENTLMEDEKRISDYDIENKVVSLREKTSPDMWLRQVAWIICEVQRACRPRILHIYPEDGKVFHLDYKFCRRVFDIKQIIKHIRGIPYYKQTLSTGEAALEDSEYVENIGLTENSVLNLYHIIRFPRPLTQLQICYSKDLGPQQDSTCRR